MFKFNPKYPINVLLSFFLLTSCTGKAQKLIFTSVPELTVIDTAVKSKTKFINKQECYIVENFIGDSTSIKSIDSFVDKNKDPLFNKYLNYHITIYKKSDQTNAESIKKNKRIIDRYSQEHDMIYDYFWFQGKFACRFKYKNGEIIEPQGNIIVSDPK